MKASKEQLWLYWILHGIRRWSTRSWEKAFVSTVSCTVGYRINCEDISSGKHLDIAWHRHRWETIWGVPTPEIAVWSGSSLQLSHIIHHEKTVVMCICPRGRSYVNPPRFPTTLYTKFLRNLSWRFQIQHFLQTSRFSLSTKTFPKFLLPLLSSTSNFQLPTSWSGDSSIQKYIFSSRRKDCTVTILMRIFWKIVSIWRHCSSFSR